MERNIVSWNITNWLTIVLMVMVGYAVIGAVVSIARQYWSGDLMNATAAANGTSIEA